MNKILSEEKLTAFALGEVEGEEKAQFEQLYQTDSEIKKTIDAIRQTADLIKANLDHENSFSLSAKNKAMLKEKLNKKPRWNFAPLAMAASLLLAVGLFTVVEKSGRFDDSKPVHEVTLSKPEDKEAPMLEANEPLAPLQVKNKKVVDGITETQSGGYTGEEKDDDDADIARYTAIQDFNTETYDRIEDNPFLDVIQSPLSTFSVDVDTASYSNLRRFIMSGQTPPKDAVRIEEMINYFTYDYPQPTGSDPFAVVLDVAEAPWNPEHRLVKIGIKGKDVDWKKKPASNLVFLIDVSGSMNDANKLPLLKKSLKMMSQQMGINDRISIVVYAGSSGLVLPPTPGTNKNKILEALDHLEAGGSTNGGQGIELAYKVAKENFIKGGINRVILATDGDFNVGTTNQGDLTRMIEEKAKSGVFLSVLGFGSGNYKDSTMEKLADKGNGNYAYIDNFNEAKKALGEQLMGTLMTIAKDVKIQVEFNPAAVAGYRLIGYENRILRAEDFNNDKIDAGDIGAGHTVTALYEVVPQGQKLDVSDVDPLKYQPTVINDYDMPINPELLTVKLRYKAPDGNVSKLISMPLKENGQKMENASGDFKFAAAVVEFGMILRDSPYKGNSNLESVLKLADAGKGEDKNGYRIEFMNMVHQFKKSSSSPIP